MATPISRRRTQIGWVVVAASLGILPAAVHAATHPDPVLRPSETLDIRRLGTTTDDERAVLRVEWRSAETGLAESHAVEEMLIRLRRMEGTVSEIGRLIRGMPAVKPAAPSIAAEPAQPEDHDARWALAASAAAVLLAFWWTRRRESTKPSRAGPSASPVQVPAVARVSDAVLPELLPPDRAEPTHAPAPIIAVAQPKAPPATPPPKPSAESGSEEILSEDFTATVITRVPPAPPAAPLAAAEPVPAAEPAPSPTEEAAAPVTSAPGAEEPPIEFSLEDEDPEAIARANARVPVPRTRNSAHRAPERRRDTNIEPTLQLAEIMLSMGLEQGAAQALLEYIDANPKHALYHWLKLLGIYRKRGLHQEFTETAEKLRQNFNIQAQAWTNGDSGETPTLESFPRVSEHVQEIWSRPEECRLYLQHLLEDNRDGGRAGFPQSVAEEILQLVEILKEISGANQVVGT